MTGQNIEKYQQKELNLMFKTENKTLDIHVICQLGGLQSEKL